ncbi:MAG TPA: sulfite exporter TauE/SafE family protein [Bryobacteraceae bacterium]|nr:sulfite exporter TauE/SafE family protein [Bryobacteraceae bacterium]
MLDATALHVIFVALIATLIRSSFGFGEALVAVPLLALRIPVSIAAPLAVLLSITVAAVVVAQDWRRIHARSAGWLIAPSFFGIPLGIYLLKGSHHTLIKIVLAAVIIGFSTWSLIGKNPPRLADDSRPWLLSCGFLAGVLGGAFGMNAPPLVVYGAMRRWSPQHFRATLQGYFLPSSGVALAGYWVSGLWKPEVTHYYLISLPGVIPAIFLGRWINHRLRGDSFLKFVHLGLIAVAVVLLVQAVR